MYAVYVNRLLSVVIEFVGYVYIYFVLSGLFVVVLICFVCVFDLRIFATC